MINYDDKPYEMAAVELFTFLIKLEIKISNQITKQFPFLRCLCSSGNEMCFRQKL